jgi:hypothetical protein
VEKDGARLRNARQAVTPARDGTIQQTGRALRDGATENLVAAKKPRRRTISAGISRAWEVRTDTLDRVFLGTAAAGVAVLVALTLLLSVAAADPVPAAVLQTLTGFHPAAALGGARASYQHARHG